MSRTALLLLVATLTGTALGSAQVTPPSYRDGPFPSPFARTCDPSGNIDEIPFDASSVPLEDWLKERKARQIPMEMRVADPELRMDQQTAVSYNATIHLKNPKAAALERKVVFFVGVDSAEGKRLTETSVHAVSIPSQIKGNFDLAVSGCVYLRPGSYSLWIAAHDENTENHSVRRQNLRVSPIKNDPLPLLESRNPPARFPDYTPEETGLDKALPASLFLPVSNKRPLAIDIVSLNPHQRHVIGPLSQMALKDSLISVATLDLERQEVVYDSRGTEAFDFTELLKAAERHKQLERTIDLSVLINRDSAGYLRRFLEQRIKSSDGRAHVLFVVSWPMTFQRGEDLSATALDANCECRLFHVQMSPGSGHDDLEKVLKSPRSRRLEVTSALEFRKLLASIIRELEAF
jgi:hypothetical protein